MDPAFFPTRHRGISLLADQLVRRFTRDRDTTLDRPAPSGYAKL
ncbi:hypothetical protein [Shimia sp. W99]